MIKQIIFITLLISIGSFNASIKNTPPELPSSFENGPLPDAVNAPNMRQLEKRKLHIEILARECQ